MMCQRCNEMEERKQEKGKEEETVTYVSDQLTISFLPQVYRPRDPVAESSFIRI